MTEINIEKRGFRIDIPEEFALYNSGFEQKGHWEEIPLTDEDRASHARAVAAYEEVNSNPWISLSGYEYDFAVEPLEPKRTFVPEETEVEWMARWVAAGRPNTFQDAMRARIVQSYASGVISPESAFANASRLMGAA